MIDSGSYMRPPEEEKVYEVGDRVEVNCDHEDKACQRIRGWLKGTVVQVDALLPGHDEMEVAGSDVDVAVHDRFAFLGL